MKRHELRLSDLLARTIEVGDCWVWTGHAQLGKYPQWTVDGKPRPVRRLLWSLIHETEPVGRQVGVRCQTLLCVHPECLVARTRSGAMQGVFPTASHRIRMTLVNRRGALITMDQARAIRASDERNPVLAERYGITASYVSKIRTGVAWRDTGSPFAGLLA